MPRKTSKPKPVEITGGGIIQPKRKTWNTGQAFIPPARIADIPGPRRSASNRRMPSAKELKKLVPKKSKRNQKSLSVPAETQPPPSHLEEAEEGYWEADGRWIASTTTQVKQEDETSGKEDPHIKVDEQDPQESSRAPTPDEVSSRLVAPIRGFRTNPMQKAINRATSSSTRTRESQTASNNRSLQSDASKLRPLTPRSLRTMHGYEEEPPTENLPLFYPHDLSDSSEDLESVEKAFPFDYEEEDVNTRPAHRPSNLPGVRSTDSSRYLNSNSRVPDSVDDISSDPMRSAERHRNGQYELQRRSVPPRDTQEPPTTEGDEAPEDKENLGRTQKSNRVKTYGKRIKYAYRIPHSEPQPYSQPTRSRLPSQADDSLQSLTKSQSRGRSTELEGLRQDSSQYQEAFDERCSSEDTEVAEKLEIEDPFDPDWSPELEAMFGGLPSSLPHRGPDNGMVAITAAYPAHRFRIPDDVRPPIARRPLTRRPKLYQENMPFFDTDPRARLAFTQSELDLAFGNAQNHLRVPIRVRKPKLLPLQSRGPPPDQFLRPFPRITIEEFRERYRHEEYRFPANPRFVKAYRSEPTRRAPQWRDPPRHPNRAPAEPRIVHPSDNLSEAIMSFPATQSHDRRSGRIALHGFRKTKKPAAPRLQFTSKALPSQPSVVTSGPTSAGPSRTQTTTSAPPNAQQQYGSTGSSTPRQSSINPNPIHPFSYDVRHVTTSSQAPRGILKPFIPQEPLNPPLLCQPGESVFLHYVPVPDDQDGFEPDDEPPAVPTDVLVEEEEELIAVKLSEGDDEILIPRKELDAMEEADLDRMTKSIGSSKRKRDVVDEIEEFGPNEKDPELVAPQSQAKATPTRRALGDITGSVSSGTSGSRLSGVDMTDHLLNLARLAVNTPIKRPDPRQRRLDEKRERLQAKRRAERESEKALKANPPSSSPLSATSLVTPHQPPSRAIFATATNHSPTNPIAIHPRHVQSTAYRRAPQPSTSLNLPPRLYPTKSLPSLAPQPTEEPSPPLKRTKSMVTAQFKLPRRTDEPPPPEPTKREKVALRLAKSFPSFARAFPLPAPPPAPPPAPLGIGGPLRMALKRTRTHL